nr:hypothetical protein BaRGS_000910 [Batillaria attramentaria]
MKEPPPPPARAPALPPRRGTHDVETLSVDDVGERLKQLNLEKYRKKFKKNLIDGVLLKGMSQDTLVKEFRMSAVEALREQETVDRLK